MKKNTIVKNTTMLYIMTIAKLLFPLLTLPYLTRVLTTESYGLVSYVKAVMQYMQIIIDFGFILSGTKDIVLSRNNKVKLGIETGNILAAKILLGIGAFIALITMTFLIPILRENKGYVFISYIPIFLTCFLMDYFFRGIEQMETITLRFITMKGISTGLTFIFVKSDADLIMIPILDIIGTFIAILFVMKELLDQNIPIKVSNLKNVVTKIKESAMYFYSNIATTAFSALNTLLIGIYLNKIDVAYWSLCMQLVTAVQSMYTPLTDGIYPQMVVTRNIKIIKKVLKIFLPLISLGCLFTFFIAKYALYLIGGSKYIDAAPVLQSLTPLLFFSFLAVLFGWPTLGAIGKVKETTITTAVSAIIQVIGLIILLLYKQFTLINICLLRNITEIMFFLLRFRYYWKFRSEFSTK